MLWCLKSRDLFAPALASVGLHPDRVIYAETRRESEILPAVEEGLRHRGLAGVVGEVARLGLTPSRRLQLAAEETGVPALRDPPMAQRRRARLGRRAERSNDTMARDRRSLARAPGARHRA